MSTSTSEPFPPPARRMRSTAAAARASLRATSASFAPRAARSSAPASPIPLVAPVITTRLPRTPLQSVMGRSGLAGAEQVGHRDGGRGVVEVGADPEGVLDRAQERGVVVRGRHLPSGQNVRAEGEEPDLPAETLAAAGTPV